MMSAWRMTVVAAVVVVVASLLQLKAQELDTGLTIISDLRIVTGANEAEANEHCARMCPCRHLLTTNLRSNWMLAGGKLAMDSTKNDEDSYICIRKDPVRAFRKTPSTMVALEGLVLFRQSGICPPGLKAVFSPGPNSVMCARLVPAPIALATGTYISDIVVSTDEDSVDLDENWSELAMDDREHSQSRSSTIHLKRPRRPITGMQVVQVNGARDTWHLCAHTLGPLWHFVGMVSSSSVMCIERGMRVLDLENPVSTPATVLVNVTTSPSGCGLGHVVVELGENLPTLCLQYVEWQPALSYVVELQISTSSQRFEMDRSSSAELVKFSEDFHGLQANRDDMYVVYRVAQVEARAPEDTATFEIPQGTYSRPPLVARNPPTRGRSNQRLSFKILQLADLHLTGDPEYPCIASQQEWADCGQQCTERVTTSFVRDLLDVEKPDFVVFSGDTITIADVARTRDAIEAAFQPVEERQTPYAVILGNHDDRVALTREEIVEVVRARNHSYMERGPKSIKGVGNYVLPVQAPPIPGPWGSANATVFRMYFLDSNTYKAPTDFPNIHSRYDWVRPEQIAYYRNLSSDARQEDRNAEGAMKPTPAIMFFHIPIPEYGDAGPAVRRSGGKNEKTEGPKHNSHLLDALRELGEVKATFVGHDHLNDFCLKAQGVQLCHGGGTGFGRSYGELAVPRRARVVEWCLDHNGRRSLRSWKRLFGSRLRTRAHEEILYDEST